MSAQLTRTNTVCARHRRGGAPLFFVVGLVILVALVGAIIWIAVQQSGRDSKDAPLLAEISRGAYEHVVLEQGEVESSNNVEIRCEVRSRTQGSDRSTSVIDVIDEGTVVAEGDWLISFDSSALEQELSRQRIVVNTSEALMIEAKAVYDTALIAKEEYLKGAYNEQRKTIENEIFVAEENLKKAQLSYDSIKRLVSRGLLTELQLEGEKFRVDSAQNELDLAKQKLDVLDNYTRPKMVTQLDSDIRAAEVRYKNEQDSHQTELDKQAEIEDQIAKCKVYAPQPGQVVYANVQSSRSGSEFVVEPGAAVRERQVIIRLPDPKAMQVKASINEARVNLVHEGMPVDIRIDAFGDKVLRGEVTKVNKYAEPGNWWSSSSKQYATLIRINNPPPGTRVGLTAEVQIHVEHRNDALQMPVQAVYERGGKTFCLVKSEERYDTREVAISSTNEKMVAIDETISEPLGEGQQVVINPRRHLDLFDQSRFPQDDEPKSPPDEELAQTDDGAAGEAQSNEGTEDDVSADVRDQIDSDGDGGTSTGELQAVPGGAQ